MESGENKAYRILILIVIALLAFSSAMKELNQFQAVAIDTSSVLASLSDTLVPTANANAPVKAEACTIKGWALPGQ